MDFDKGILPIPLLQYFYQINRQAPDALLIAFCDKYDKWFARISKVIGDLRGIGTIDRTPNKFLDSLGDLLYAYFEDLDDDRTKRAKLKAAIPRHKERGTFTYDIGPKIDSIAGGDSYVYSNSFQTWINDFVLLSGDPAEGYDSHDFSLLDSGEEDYGMILLAGSDPYFEVAGNVFIDVDNASLTAQDIIDIKELLNDSIAAYLRIFLGYLSGGNFIVYANGIIN
jgi:hypothetical protein